MDIEQILRKLRITELNEMQQHAAEAIMAPTVMLFYSHPLVQARRSPISSPLCN